MAPPFILGSRPTCYFVETKTSYEDAAMNSDIAEAMERDVAALDEMLRAIGRWQAAPSEKTWQQKLIAIRQYLAAIESWGAEYMSSVFRTRAPAVRT
jgi:hypothetical protein